MAKREHGHDESSCEVALVLQRPPQRDVGRRRAPRAQRDVRDACAAASSNTSSRKSDGTTPAPSAASSASSAASTTTRSRSRSAGSMTANPCSAAALAAAARTRGGRCDALRRGQARPRGEGRPSRRAAGPRRSRCPRAGLLERCDDPTDDFLSSATSAAIDGVERRRPDRRIGVVEQARRACCGRRPTTRRGRARTPPRAARQRSAERRGRPQARRPPQRPCVAVGGEPDERPHPHLGIRVRAMPRRAHGRSRRIDRRAAGRGRGARHVHRRT